MDVVVISPEPGMAKEIGRRLLELADHPRDVQWTTYPKAGFAIPLELFARFDTDEETAETDDTETAERKPQRRRGRPRKEETSTDNNTSEEG